MQGAASRTAMMVSAYRARASRAEHGLCDDPWAAALAGEEGMRLAAAMDEMQPEMELWIAVRTAAIDRHVRALIGGPAGIAQVVILGAGLDTRAARLATDGVQFFEVDHPATQQEKRRRIGQLADFPVDAATHAPCDFERDDFLDRLVDVGFDPKRPAAVVWEGVTCYLTESAVRATLRRIAIGCNSKTSVIFDTVGKVMARGSSSHDEDRRTRDLVDTLGEPVRWGTNDPLPLLYEEGFRRIRVVRFDEAALWLTGTYDRARRWRFQALVRASVAPIAGEEDAV